MADSRFFTAADPLTLAQIAGLTGAVLTPEADPGFIVRGAAPLGVAGPHDIGFVQTARNLGALSSSAAGACFVPSALVGAEGARNLLIAQDTKFAWVLTARRLHPEPGPKPGISPAAHIAPDAVIGAGCEIGPGAVIGAGVEVGTGSVIGACSVIGAGCRIGAGVRIAPHVTISHALIGDDVILHPGVRIGQDGFGYVPGPAALLKVPQLGRVIVGDAAEIGANTTIDRGAGDDTVIGPDCKIDNLVMIGHNCRLGRGCILISQVGLAGSVTLGDYVVLGGKVAVGDHLTIGAGARVAGRSGVTKDIPASATYGGFPAVEVREWRREVATLRRLARQPRGH